MVISTFEKLLRYVCLHLCEFIALFYEDRSMCSKMCMCASMEIKTITKESKTMTLAGSQRRILDSLGRRSTTFDAECSVV